MLRPVVHLEPRDDGTKGECCDQIRPAASCCKSDALYLAGDESGDREAYPGKNEVKCCCKCRTLFNNVHDFSLKGVYVITDNPKEF